MNKIGINDKGLGVFKRAVNSAPKVKENQQNPFAVSFGSKNLANDVFQLSNPVKKSVKEVISNKMSAHQESFMKFIQNSREFIAKKSTPIADFAKNTKQQISKAWNRLNEIEVNTASIKDMFAHLRPETQNKGIAKEVVELMKKPVNELETMFKAEIA